MKRFWKRMLTFMSLMGLINFVDGYCRSRNWLTLLWGLPALLTLLGGIAVVLVARAEHDRIADWHLSEGAKAFNEDAVERGQVAFKRVLRHTPRHPQARYQLALLQEKGGRLPQARSLMTDLANESHGYTGPAAVWLAMNLERSRPPGAFTDESKSEQLRLLKTAVRHAPDDVRLQVMLAQALVRARLFDQAIPHYRAALGQRPELALELAAVYRGLGQHEKSQEVLREMAAKLREQLRNDPYAQVPRRTLALLQMSQGEFAEASGTLQEGLQLSPNDEGHRKLLAVIYSAWAISQERTLGPGLPRLALLQRALAVDPQCVQAFQALLELANRDAASRSEIVKAVEAALAQGESPALAHTLLGAIALLEQDLPRAQQELEMALQMDGQTPVVLNNLAWVAAHQEPADLEAALRLVDQALALSPQEPRIRDTRGRILYKMQRWQAALPDLEAALAGLRQERIEPAELKELHRCLADIYAQLGRPEMAERHRDHMDAIVGH